MVVHADLCSEVIRVETRVDEHDRRFAQIGNDLKDATTALWQAVESMRSRPQVHPVMAAVIATLTCMIGVLATFAIHGG